MRSHAATQQIRESISLGKYSPGTKLNEKQLAEQLGISRNTLRECFADLASQGVLTRLPHRGVYISVPSRDEVQDFYTARALIEPTALRTTNLNVGRLESIVAAAEEARDTGQLAKLSDANQRFHKAIASSVGSKIIDETMGRILALMRLAFMQVLNKDPDFHIPYVSINRSVVDALKIGDRTEAAHILEQSLLTTREEIAEHLTKDVVYGP